MPNVSPPGGRLSGIAAEMGKGIRNFRSGLSTKEETPEEGE